MRLRSRLAKRATAAVLSLAAAGLFSATTATPASAGDFNGSCEGGEVCLWWSVGYTGPIADFYNNVSSYNNWHFYNSSYWLANNTESAKNEATFSCVDFFDNANYSGNIHMLMSGRESGNLEADKNKIESHKFTSTFPYSCEI